MPFHPFPAISDKIRLTTGKSAERSTAAKPWKMTINEGKTTRTCSIRIKDYIVLHTYPFILFWPLTVPFYPLTQIHQRLHRTRQNWHAMRWRRQRRQLDLKSGVLMDCILKPVFKLICAIQLIFILALATTVWLRLSFVWRNHCTQWCAIQRDDGNCEIDSRYEKATPTQTQS